MTAAAARDLIDEVRRALEAIVNSTEQSDQIDGLERQALRSLDALAAERERTRRLEEARDEAEEHIQNLENALLQASMNLATARDTRWGPYDLGEMPDKSLGEIADDWYALLMEQARALASAEASDV